MPAVCTSFTHLDRCPLKKRGRVEGGVGSDGLGVGADHLNFQQSPEPNATFEGGLVF